MTETTIITKEGSHTLFDREKATRQLEMRENLMWFLKHDRKLLLNELIIMADKLEATT